jgi:hypothetical protein
MQRLTLKYRTGEEIRKGDRVRFHGNPAAVELVSFDPNDPNPEVAWHMKEFGGGVLISDPMVSAELLSRMTISTNTRTWSLFLVSEAPRSRTGQPEVNPHAW